MAAFDTALNHSNRFQKFRNNLIKQIPRIPNNNSTLKALQSKNNTELLIIYMCWRLRHVAARPRQVTGLSNLEADYHINKLKPNIDAFIEVVETGGDLGPYLSKKAHTHGYVMASDTMEADIGIWDDMDFVLNVMGIHHFHLGLVKEKNGLITRTKKLLFAEVTRDTFHILGIYNHKAFEFTVDNTLGPERERLWSMYDKLQDETPARGIKLEGHGGLGITMSGTPEKKKLQ